MQGLILAAGMGKRLKNLTQNNTKCMVKVNGVTLIERMLYQLEQLKLSRIIIVVGYEGQKLVDYIKTLKMKTNIVYVWNPIYNKTNNIYSLALAKNFLVEEDTLLLESDLILESSLLESLVNDSRETLALVDKYESWMDGTVIKLDNKDNILEFVSGKKIRFEDIKEYYKTVNIYKFSKQFSETHYIPFLDAYSKALGNNEYYEQVLRVIAMLDEPGIKGKRLNGEKWYEIDDIQDLDIASSMFAQCDQEKVKLIQNRYGGYWRYPKMLDFCYLVNPYYPPQGLLNEIKSNFKTLLTQYPSGMRVNSLLAAKKFGVEEEHILVGNGAAELIRSLMKEFSGLVGFVRPTFEEYPNRYEVGQSVIYSPENALFQYSAKDIMDYFQGKQIKSLLIINPDNPSGNYIKKAEMLNLVEWALEKGIILVVDESFVDFSEENDSSLISNEYLKRFPNLIVLKSISKSYGVPGLRLGVLASSNVALICKLKKDVSIWNINSFAEFYMQIEEKYYKSYVESLEELRYTRKKMIKKLEKIEGIRVIPSQANYIMIKLECGIESSELTKKLLVNYNILIKDLTGKIEKKRGEYIRIAIRKEEDNNSLINALQEIIYYDIKSDSTKEKDICANT